MNRPDEQGIQTGVPETGKKPPLIILAGPTAVGKTELSLRLAHAVNGEIISADSMQVYRGLDIGSAKLPPEERDGIEHHLIDVLDPEEPFDVYRFQKMAGQALQEIRERRRIPILTGGTGFYIQAVARGVDFTENGRGEALRRKWTELAEREGAGALFEKLQEADPESAGTIHPHNVKRVIRALEFFEQTGMPISAHNRQEKERESPYNVCYFVLTDDRAYLYGQINRRVDIMLENGLEQEVRALYESGLTEDCTSMKAIGYKEFFPYFRGEYSLEEAVRLIKQNTRHYAKRQLTWFRREPDAVWIDRQKYGRDPEKILAAMLEILKKKEILTESGNGHHGCDVSETGDLPGRP